ncbi:MAG: ABC transporter substrate-binding protein [Longimicrobiales bacterium]|nr:ABC transporter substrate-binding protein [Longimicrobiales bacterium]
MPATAMSRMNRFALALAVAMSLGLGACAPDDEDGPQTGASRVVVGLSELPGHLNPAITTAGGVHTVSEILYDGLIRLEDDLRVRPALARAWSYLDDGRVVRFRLRTDARWHDGTPFTARDVVYSFQEVLLRYHSRTRASLGTALTGVEMVDDSTVDFRFREPYGPLLRQLDVTEAPILPAHLYSETDPLTNPANRAPVGTGPYRFVRYDADGLRYAANPDYHDGRPSIDELHWRLIPDAGTQVTALERGALDWLFAVPGPERRRLEEDPTIRLLETTRGPGGSNCVMTLGFNLDRPLFGDERTRWGIGHAIDRAQIVDRVLFGQGRVAEAPISSGIPFAHAPEVELPGHDPEAAQRLLADAGWGRDADGRWLAMDVNGVTAGTPLAFDFTHFPSFSQYAQLLRAQLLAVGIELRLRPMEPPVFVEAVFTERAFDTNVVSYCHGPDPEIGVRRMYISSNIAPVPFSNGAAYANPVVDSLFDQARRSLDVEERGDRYRRIQEIVARDLPYLPLVETESTRAHTARCSGFRAGGHFAAEARCRR